MRNFLGFILIAIFVSSNAFAQNKSKRSSAKAVKKHKNISVKESRKILEEINKLRQDYLIYKSNVKDFIRTTDYLVKRIKRNETRFLEGKLAKDVKQAKIKDIIERAKLLKVLEKRLSKYKNKPNPLWTPELLWRTAVLYYEIAEELAVYYIDSDETTGKHKYDDEYTEILNGASKASKGLVRPADSTLGVDYYKNKAEEQLRELISKYPGFRAIGSAYHLLARIYEKPPFSNKDPAGKMPAKISLAAVCTNWNIHPYKESLKEILIKNGSKYLSPNSKTDYKNWNIYDFPTPLPFDPFKRCKPVNASVEFVGTAWATLGKYLSAGYRLEFVPENTDEDKLYNLAMTKWYALSAYKRALGPEYKALSTRGYIIYFAGLMMYQNEINPALAMKLFDQVVTLGQDKDSNSPHEAAIKYIGFLLQEEKFVPEGDNEDPTKKFSWTKPYPVTCQDKCPLKKLMVFYKGKESQPHVKRVWKGVADFFMGIEGEKTYQRSDDDYLSAYRLYDYIFRKMDMEGGWRYNPDKPDIFWNMLSLIDNRIDKFKADLKDATSDRERNTVNQKIKHWTQKKKDLYQFAVSKIFTTDEIQNFLTSYQKDLLENSRRKIHLQMIPLAKLRNNLISIRQYALMDTGQAIATKAIELAEAAKKATGAEKNRLKAKAKAKFNEVISYYKSIIKDYPNSSLEYDSMNNILMAYKDYIIDLASNEKERKTFIYKALDWGRKVRDSHLGSSHQKDAASVIYEIYVDKLKLKIPAPPFDVKKEKNLITYKPQPIPNLYKQYMKDAREYMNIFPKNENTPIFLNNMADIYLHYQHIKKARALYWTLLDKYCHHTVSINASTNIFLSYKFEKPLPQKEEEFFNTRKSVIKKLASMKCGGDKEHRELILMITQMEFNELVKKAQSLYSEAEKAKTDNKKWMSAYLAYVRLEQRFRERNKTKKQKDFEKLLFGMYWKMYTCQKNIGNYQEAINILNNKIYSDKTMLKVADKDGYKEFIIYELASAATKFFQEKLAIRMWKELTVVRRGYWRIKKGKKIKIRDKSSYRFEAEEKLFWMYKAMGEKAFNKAVRQAYKIISLVSRARKIYRRLYEVPEKDAYKTLGKKLGVASDQVDNFYKLSWSCNGGTCKIYVTDKEIFYKEIVYNMYLSRAFKDGSEDSMRSVLAKINDFEGEMDKYVPYEKLTSKAHEAMWRKRLGLIYTKALVWKKLVSIYKNKYDKQKKAKEQYIMMLKSYKDLYDQGIKKQLNPGFLVINYAEALILYANDELVKPFKNPFKSSTTIELKYYQQAKLAAVAWQQSITGAGNKVNEEFTKLQKKLQELQQKYIAELQDYVQTIVKLQNAAKLSNKDKIAYYKKFQRYQRKYPKFIKYLQKYGLNNAVSKTIQESKDIKKINKKLIAIQKSSQKLLPDSIKKFMKTYLPLAKKALKSVKARYKKPLPVLKTIEKGIKAINPSKAQVQDIQNLLALMSQMAWLSVVQQATDTVVSMLANGSTLESIGESYSWYTKQKGLFRKQVATIKANMLALKMILLEKGIKIFKKAPYDDILAKEDLKTDKAKKFASAGCKFATEKANIKCYLNYRRKIYYDSTYQVPIGGKSENIKMIPLDKITEEYNKSFNKLYSLIKSERVTSDLIEQAINGYGEIMPSAKSFRGVFSPMIEKVSF